jgi:two-component system chemotaxis response regulator CheY
MEYYDLTELSFLIVEKHLPMSSMLRSILRELGVTDVHAASSPDAGFEDFNYHVPDVVLVDWLPGFDGIGLLKIIRSDAASKSPFVPIIMVTAHGKAENVFEARDAGMTEYLTKPISGTRLYQRISLIVKSNRDFVRASKFFGPGRRRRTKEFERSNRRGAAPVLSAVRT